MERQTQPDGSGFAGLLADACTRFIRLDVAEIDSAIEEALGKLVRWLGVDRSTLLDLTPDGAEIQARFVWALPGLDPVPKVGHLNDLRWFRAHLRAGNVVRLSNMIAELPEEATDELEMTRALGQKSALIVPLEVGRERICALSVGTLREFRAWTDVDVSEVRRFGEVLAAALARRRSERSLAQNRSEIERLNRQLQAENVYLREELWAGHDFDEIVGKSEALRRAVALAERVAPTGSSVLLLGETGTGKELLARVVHTRSARAHKPLVKLNCAALPAGLVESELFGHEKGAFTGAASARPGRFEVADGGTLFLDEVGELPLEAQAKLLRVIQDGEFERLGSPRSRKVDVRLVAATNRDLEREVEAGRFRADLYYRLSVLPITLPPLRERRDDIAPLVWFFIHRKRDLGRHIEKVPRAAMRALEAYDWPGNVRELENVVERAMIVSSGDTLRLDIAFDMRAPASGARVHGRSDRRLESVERKHIEGVLAECGWKINGSGNGAERLGLKPSTLRSRMRKLGIARPRAAGRPVPGRH